MTTFGFCLIALFADSVREFFDCFGSLSSFGSVQTTAEGPNFAVLGVGQSDMVRASRAEMVLKTGDMRQLKSIVHPVAYENLDKWEKFYK